MTEKLGTYRCHDVRRRGTVYVLVLGASLLVAAIGISSLMAARVRHKATQASTDLIQARISAQSMIDWVLLQALVNEIGQWRVVFQNGSLVDVPFAGGTMSATGVDPVDGDILNNLIDPVILRGIGQVGQARYILEVTLNGDGTVVPGTWKRVVN